MSEFDTLKNDFDSLPDIERRMTSYSKILFDLSLPGKIRKHEHTYTHYKKQLIALGYEYTRIKGKNKLTKKLDTMLKRIEKLREIEYKS